MTTGKKILIFGLGKEGASAARYLQSKNEVTVVDQKPKEEINQDFLEGIDSVSFHTETDLPENENFGLIVRSPGVRPDNSTIRKLTANGAQLTSPTQIFFEESPARIIGVTGTKGKGTTSTLIYEMLKTEGEDVHLAGNIGTPMLDILQNLSTKSVVVLELSSFQLVDLTKSPHIAVVLMITSEHLNWHTDEGEYQEAKTSIVKFQTEGDFAVVNDDFEASKSFSQKTKAKVLFFSTKKSTNGTYLEGNNLVSASRGKIIGANEVLLPGPHNIQNALAASAAAELMGISSENIASVLKSFKGLKHRLQLIRDVDGVKYYNDSFSTTPETTIAAIEAFDEPKILILGGSSKNSNFKSLAQKILSTPSIKALIFIGTEAETIKKAISQEGTFGGKIQEGPKSIEEIVEAAYNLAESGDIALLSPACASFDMFKNYEDRGEQFIKEVEKL
ncbi:MAG: UDP-N-acetylmuramoyl-L-alanine--D-glutamate ligase [Candidatus Curtissbacteria bacterium]|nr:UDP-N-acetylmuramoyl-L-alanine--D-glutamate ligase [Candidatus Curtissbacteria bacterium]